MHKFLIGSAALALAFGFAIATPASAAPASGAAIGSLAASQALITDVRERRCEMRCRHREFSKRVCVKRCVSGGDRW